MQRLAALAFALAVAVVALGLARPTLGAAPAAASTPDRTKAHAAQAGPLRVVTSTGIFLDMVTRVGGPSVDAFSIVPPGADPHTYQPSPRDVQRLQGTRVAIWNGLGLDETSSALVASQGLLDLTTVVLSEGLAAIGGAHDHGDEHGDEHTDDDEHGHGHAAGGNPHLWLDPTNAVQYVILIRDALVAADPGNATAYQQNAATYIAEIEALDTWAQGEIATIPAERRKLVTFHDAFPYLAAHYGLEPIGVVLKSPGREPSAQEVAALVTEIKRHNIPTVYAEPQFNARILELAARDAGIQVKRLYSDALDDQVTTYLDLMRFNITSLVDGLR